MTIRVFEDKCLSISLSKECYSETKRRRKEAGKKTGNRRQNSIALNLQTITCRCDLPLVKPIENREI